MRVLVGISSLVLIVACGAPPQAVAQPRQAAAQDTPLFAGPAESDADLARAIREHYTKFEYRIPMRDGVRLATDVYVPKDHARAYPFMMVRTPYSIGPYGADAYPSEKNGRGLRRFAPSPGFVKDGYIFVHQDVRGRMMSEGTFVDVRPHAATHATKTDIDESTDAWDTVDWLVKNVSPNNGKVGVWGISYPGFYAAQAAVDAHPAVKAVSPQAPVTEWFIGDDFHHNGAFFLAAAFDFYAVFGRARPQPTTKLKWGDGAPYDSGDAYDFFLGLGSVANADLRYFKGSIAFWNDATSHPNRDAWWQARDPRPFYKESRPAIMTTGGFYDAEDLFGALQTYQSFEHQGPRADNTLVMGPWRHGGWARAEGDHLGDIGFGQKASQYYRDEIELPFFRKHLKGVSGPATPEAIVFETGTDTWQRFTAWPPREAKPATLSLRAHGGLATGALAADDAGGDAYVSNPAKPVPYSVKPGIEIDEEYMTEDQRFAARRPDVLVYASRALDADVTLAGPITANLWVTTTGTDADFVVKLVDVHPSEAFTEGDDDQKRKMSGYQELVRAEIMRGRFRNDFAKPEAFKPGEPTLVKIALPDVMHTFRTGHKLMVQVQSSWFPLVNRNPQTFVESIYKATDADFKAQTHTVLRGKDHASSLDVGVLRGALP